MRCPRYNRTSSEKTDFKGFLTKSYFFDLLLEGWRCKDGAEFTIEYLHLESGGIPGPEWTKNAFVKVG